MIISHKYKFIFVKTFKTAGTSIEVYLSQFCDESDTLTPVVPIEVGHKPRNFNGLFNPFPDLSYPHFPSSKGIKDFIKGKKFDSHMPARLVKARIDPEIWRSYYKFCVERNPWDKTISHYHMLVERCGYPMTMEQYFDNGVYCFNWPLYTDSKDRIIVDRVLRYESLEAGLSEVFNKLKVPFNGHLDVKAKVGIRKDKRPYQEIYSQSQCEWVRRTYEKEIKYHGYSFE
jgi:hypothetical protein